MLLAFDHHLRRFINFHQTEILIKANGIKCCIFQETRNPCSSLENVICIKFADYDNADTKILQMSNLSCIPSTICLYARNWNKTVVHETLNRRRINKKSRINVQNKFFM